MQDLDNHQEVSGNHDGRSGIFSENHLVERSVPLALEKRGNICRMKLAIDLLYDTRQDTYHASSLYAGFDELSQRGVIDFRFRRPRRAERDLITDPLAVCLLIRREDVQRQLLVAIDLHDQGDVFATEVLQRCDRYYKRTFCFEPVASLPFGMACKVRPFGLNYAVRTWGSTRRLLSTASPSLLFSGLAGVRRLRHHLLLPKIADFEQAPSALLEPTVVFQTRVWEAGDTALGESEAINQTRVGLIRALREAFGQRFRGGLVPTTLAISKYPMEVSPYSSRRSLYTAMSKKNLIAIYTRGLHGSTAFKLAEYLAASQCIVAEPLREVLPQPLVSGKHFLPFQNVDECIESCQRIFANSKLASSMRQANYQYYKSQVEPSSHVENLLNALALDTCAQTQVN